MGERDQEDFQIPDKIQCKTCGGTGRKIVWNKRLKHWVLHEETINIQVRTDPFSNRIEEFVMDRTDLFQNKEPLYFSVNHMISNNVDPFEDQSRPANHVDPFEDQSRPANHHHAVLLDYKIKSFWKSTKPLWFIATDTNTRRFLEYLNEKKRFALRTDKSDRQELLDKALDQANKKKEYVVEFGKSGLTNRICIGLDVQGNNAIVLGPQCTSCNGEDGCARGWICKKKLRTVRSSRCKSTTENGKYKEEEV